jgi:hypothetical protein
MQLVRVNDEGLVCLAVECLTASAPPPQRSRPTDTARYRTSPVEAVFPAASASSLITNCDPDLMQAPETGLQ